MTMTTCLSLGDLHGVKVGHATDEEALTGCTAVLFPEGAVAGHAEAGVATGSRELGALTPRHLVQRIHGICLSGGSAFGLASASGVVRRLEEAGVGHKTSFGRVPIVPAAVVYDLNIGSSEVRPDEQMGWAAADAAMGGAPAASGNVGAGVGVSSGKFLGVKCATKTGLGNAGVSTMEGLRLAALVVLNPVGDVVHPDGGGLLAGARAAPDSDQLVGTSKAIRSGSRCAPLHQSNKCENVHPASSGADFQDCRRNEGESNTTLCVVATNAELSKVEAAWLAEQAVAGLARGIDPPFTRHDGDLVFAASVGGWKVQDPEAGLHRLAVLTRDVLAMALRDACMSAKPAGGLPTCHNLKQPEK